MAITPLFSYFGVRPQIVNQHPQTIIIQPGPNHWDIFIDLCKLSDAKGNLISDAYHAALAIESGCEWITTDRDFARFPGLKWHHPFGQNSPR